MRSVKAFGAAVSLLLSRGMCERALVFLYDRLYAVERLWRTIIFQVGITKSRGTVGVISTVFKRQLNAINCVLFMCNGGGLEAVLKLIIEKAAINTFFQKRGLVDLKCS